MNRQIIDTLEQLGKKTQSVQWDDGSRLVFLPYGGRLLGLFPESSESNFYWVNAKLSDRQSAAEVFTPDQWHNTGGERTWIAPELDIFFRDYPACTDHWEPPQLDASNYHFEMNGSKVVLSRRMDIYLARPQKQVRVFLEKEYGSAPNPLRLDWDFASDFPDVSYAGYTQRTALTYEGDGVSPSLGIWNINQFPHGGVTIIPTWYPTRPLVLFGDIPADHLVSNPKSVIFRAMIPGEHKIAVRAAATVGRIGYVYRQGETTSLVIRNFFNNPSGDYVDVPKMSPDDLGYSVFSVSIDSALGDFTEMEYHAPAIRAELGEVCTKDVSQIWAFRGNHDQIRKITGLLLAEDQHW